MPYKSVRTLAKQPYCRSGASRERPWLCPLLQIHDELMFEILENKVKEAVIFIKNCMETQPFEEFSVPILSESATGHRFGELQEVAVDD